MSFNGAGSDTQRSQQETSQEDPVTLKMALNHENEDDAKSGSASGAAAGGGMLGSMPGSFAPYGLLPQLGVQSFGMAPGMMASMLPGMLAPVAGGQPQPSISTPGQTHNADASHGGGAGSQSQQPMVVTGMPLADYAQQWQLAQQQQQMMAMYMAYWQMYMASMYANMGLGAGVMPGAGAGFGIMPGMNPQDMMAQMQSMQGMMMAASMGGAAPGAAGAPPMFGMQPAMPGGTQMPAFMMGMPGMAAANMQMSAIPAPVPAPAPGPMPGIPGLPGMPPTTGTGLPMLPPGIQICDSLPVSLAPVPDMQGVEESDDHEDSCEWLSAFWLLIPVSSSLKFMRLLTVLDTWHDLQMCMHQARSYDEDP